MTHQSYFEHFKNRKFNNIEKSSNFSIYKLFFVCLCEDSLIHSFYLLLTVKGFNVDEIEMRLID